MAKVRKPLQKDQLNSNPVHKEYASSELMIADQLAQTGGYLYYNGQTYWEYLGTTNGDISDYRQVGLSLDDLGDYVSYFKDDGKNIIEQLRARDNIDLLPIAGYEWTPITVDTDYQFRFSVVYGNCKFIFFANENTTTNVTRVYISEDGFSWRVGAEIDPIVINHSAFGKGRFVAVTTSSTAIWSDDGIVWNSVPLTNNFISICYGGGQFVAVSTFGTNRIATSPDGINWTYRSAPVTRSWWNVHYGNGVYVAVSNAAALIYSFDGITWVEVTLTLNNWHGISYGNGTWVVGRTTFGTSYYTSTDGVNWTLRSFPVSSRADKDTLKFGKGLFVIVTTSSVNPRILTSKDGINWTIRGQSNIVPPMIILAYGGGVFVGGTTDGIVYVSGYSAANKCTEYVTEFDLTEAIQNIDQIGAGIGLSIDGNGDIQLGDDDSVVFTAKSDPLENDARFLVKGKLEQFYEENGYTLDKYQFTGFNALEMYTSDAAMYEYYDVFVGSVDFNRETFAFQGGMGNSVFFRQYSDNGHSRFDLSARRGSSLVQSIQFGLNNGTWSAVLEDSAENKGFVYHANYFTNGSQDDRWIPDWGAVKSYTNSVLTLPDGVTVKGTVTQDGNDLTLNNAWRWRINNIIYGPTGNTTLNFPSTSSGFHRIDLVVGNTSGVISRVAGTATEVENPVFAPSAPVGTIPLLEVFILETGINSFIEFALSSFVRYDINNQGLSPVQRLNARTNIQALSRDTNDSRTGTLTQNGLTTLNGNTTINGSFTSTAANFLLNTGRLENDDNHVVKKVVNASGEILFQMWNRGGSLYRAKNSNHSGWRYFTANSLIAHIKINGRIFHARSNQFDESVRRDELPLTYPQTISDAGTLNNLAITAGVGAIVVTAATDITGIVGESGQMLRIYASGGSRIIRNNSGSSDAANRFDMLTGDFTIQNGTYADFLYINSRWRLHQSGLAVLTNNTQTITGLKTIRRAGPNDGSEVREVLGFEIGNDNLYKMWIMNSQNEIQDDGEVNWWFRMRENYSGGNPFDFDRIGFHRGGTTIIGDRLPSSAIATDIATFLAGSSLGTPYPISTFVHRNMMVTGRGYFGRNNLTDTLFLTSDDMLYSAGTVYAKKGLRTADADNPTTVFDGSVVFLGNVTSGGPSASTHKMRIRHNGTLYDVALTEVT